MSVDFEELRRKLKAEQADTELLKRARRIDKGTLGLGEVVDTFHHCPYCNAILKQGTYTWDKMICVECGKESYMSTRHTNGYLWVWDEQEGRKQKLRK